MTLDKHLFAAALMLGLSFAAGGCAGEPKIDDPGRYGRTRLAQAVIDGKFDEAKTLLDAGASPSAQDGKGITPMMWAAYRSHNPLLRDMIAKQPNLNVQDRRGFTAIYHAADGKNVAGYKMLLEAGADPNIKDKGGRSASDVLRIKTGSATPDGA